MQILVLGVSSIAIELAVLVSSVWMAVRVRKLAGARVAQPLEPLGGAFLVLAGVRLAVIDE